MSDNLQPVIILSLTEIRCLRIDSSVQCRCRYAQSIFEGCSSITSRDYSVTHLVRMQYEDFVN